MSIENRLKKNFKHRSKWARKQSIDAYRLYERDIPDYPFIVDIYQDYAIINLRQNKIDFEEKKQGHLDELKVALDHLGYASAKQIIKTRKVHDQTSQYSKQSRQGLIKNIKERDFIFKVNLSDYLDTGLFLDHRPLRQKLSHMDLKGKNALNLFSYTCSLSVALAKAGATVTSVDMSNNYLNWGEENFALNDIKTFEHHFINEDCLSFLKNEQELYDVIVLDPPSFSHSKKMDGSFDVQRDHPFLLRKCFDLLSPGGRLYFSNNLRSFKIDTELPWKNISSSSLPPDFKDPKIHHLFIIDKSL